jgi:O-antigen/teichoic acid export membrane protein
MLKFLSDRFDRFFVGWLLGVEVLAFYALAMMIVELLPEGLSRLTGQVLFPAYAEMGRDRPEAVYSSLRRVRLLVALPGVVLALGLGVFAEPLIGLLYDPRYASAGPMLSVLALGLVADIVSVSYHGIILSQGKPSYLLFILIGEVIARLGAMSLGFALHGVDGLVWGVAVAEWIGYALRAVMLNRIGFWQREIDLPLLGGALLLRLALSIGGASLP